jgi:hypothetical protein
MCVLIRYDVAKLKDTGAKKEYQDRIQSRCENHDTTTELANGNWTTCKAIITESAEQIFKEDRSKTRNGWYDQACAEITRRTNQA